MKMRYSIPGVVLLGFVGFVIAVSTNSSGTTTHHAHQATVAEQQMADRYVAEDKAKDKAKADAAMAEFLSKPIYLAKDAVACPEIILLGTYLDGQHAGGEAAGHHAVANLFVHPPSECIRTLKRDRVRVLDTTISSEKLVKIDYEGLKLMARPQDLAN